VEQWKSRERTCRHPLPSRDVPTKEQKQAVQLQTLAIFMLDLHKLKFVNEPALRTINLAQFTALQWGKKKRGGRKKKGKKCRYFCKLIPHMQQLLKVL